MSSPPAEATSASLAGAATPSSDDGTSGGACTSTLGPEEAGASAGPGLSVFQSIPSWGASSFAGVLAPPSPSAEASIIARTASAVDANQTFRQRAQRTDRPRPSEASST